MTGAGRRFDPAELQLPGMTADEVAALAGLLDVARRLEDAVAAPTPAITVDFEDRIMAAVASEAPPVPIGRGWSVVGILATIRDAWRIAWGTGRPLAIRVQALALVLLAAIAIGSVGTLAAVGAARLFGGPPPAIDTTPTPTARPSPSATPSALPSPSPSPEPTLSPSPSVTSEPSPSATPSETADATATAEATETAEAEDTARPTDTPRPTDTQRPTDTPDPDGTAEPTDDSSGPGGGGGSDDDGSENSGPGGG
jgi:hypothetical protein